MISLHMDVNNIKQNKMKKYILLLFAATIVAGAKGQANYYNGQIIYIDPTLSFECKNDGYGVILKNPNDPVFTPSEMYPAKIDRESAQGMAKRNMHYLSNQAFLDAFHETFTSAELAAMADSKMVIGMTMNNQGNAVRLYMIFFNSYPYYFTIPPAKYATLYKKLKSYVKVKVLYPQINYFGGSATIKINDVIANRQLLPDYFYAK